jgi:predicted membrane channel-forming protein YqfA (hemolysin III family)
MSVKLRNIITYVFLFIILVTAIAAVIANLGLFNLDPDSNFAKTTLGGVLLEIVGAVIYVWRTSALQPVTGSAIIQLDGNVDPENIDWNPDLCSYEVRDMQAQVISTGKLNIVLGHAGWECKFPSPGDLDESITFRLTEKNGNVWEVRPFYPLSKEVVAVRRESL